MIQCFEALQSDRKSFDSDLDFGAVRGMFFKSHPALLTNNLCLLVFFFDRELQHLADQEKISPAAIKKTTLDKVLQQPGVTTAGVGVRTGLNLFNSSTSKNKKN